mmetsp:Transcript_51881/g.93294  ORF Transcript_51881/g.93294 Transcript_51881/m.93294 type:complete len:137 (-) Transcript_51881:36-446(-)
MKPAASRRLAASCVAWKGSGEASRKAAQFLAISWCSAKRESAAVKLLVLREGGVSAIILASKAVAPGQAQMGCPAGKSAAFKQGWKAAAGWKATRILASDFNGYWDSTSEEADESARLSSHFLIFDNAANLCNRLS